VVAKVSLLYYDGYRRTNSNAYKEVNNMNVSFRNLSEVNEMIIKAGFSPAGFGKHAGISRGYVNQILRGKRPPTPAIAKKIADALGKEFDDIFFIESAYKSNQSA